MNLTRKEKDWIEEHGCIHGLFPDQAPLFCPKCTPDTTRLLKLLEKRCEMIAVEEDERA